MEMEKVSDISVSLSENTDFPDGASVLGGLLIALSILALGREVQSGISNYEYTSVWVFTAVYGIILDILPRSEKEQLLHEDSEIFTPHEFTELTS